MVERAAADGWTVCFSYRDAKDQAEAITSRVQADGGAACAVRTDISNEADVLAMFQVASDLGALRGFVANAAIVPRPCNLAQIHRSALIVGGLPDEQMPS